jgi:hypothetical protein
LSVGGNIRATETITAETNLAVTGTSTHTGTTTLTGRVGIGKAPHATYACDVNGTLNATNILLGGSTITSSKWTAGTPSTNIYYNLGNVGIGTTDPLTYKLNVNGNINTSGTLTTTGNMGVGTTDTATYKLNVNGNSFFNGVLNHNTRYRPDDNFPCNKMNLWGSGGAYGFGIDGGTLDYFTGSITFKVNYTIIRCFLFR